MKFSRRWIALILVLSVFALSNASCVGDFALTHKLYDWNKGLNKWLGSFLLFLFIIIPVYGVTLIIDYIILNVIQFYGGSNPISGSAEPVTKTAEVNGTHVSMTMRPGDALNVDIVTTDADGHTRTLLVRQTETGRLDARMVENRAITGRLDATLDDEGGITRNVNGQSESFDADQVREVVERTTPGTRLAFVAP